MSTGSLIPKIKVGDVPQKEAKAFKTIGVVKEVKQREVSNGYVQIEAHLAYNREDGSEDTFYARWNVRPEWFSPDYSARIKSGEVTGSEKIQYDINMSGLTRGLFAAAGMDEIDFDQVVGQVVGFKTKNRKDDPSRLEISYFFKPKTN